MHLPAAEGTTRAHPAKAKRETVWLELAAEIAALSTLEEIDAFDLETPLEALPLGWRDVFTDALAAQRASLLEAL